MSGVNERALTALDATFLELEEADPSAHMHIGAVMVFDPLPDQRAAAPEQIAHHIERRLPGLPRYSQRLSEPRTGGLRWPAWEPHPGFDVADHVRRASLPAPGGRAELLDWAGEYFSQRLDRARPLWEIVVLEGLAAGRWALVSKTHHCLVDGVGSADVVNLLFDTEPAPGAGRWVGERPAVSEQSARRASGLVPLGRAYTGALAAARLGLGVLRLPLWGTRAGLGVAAHPERVRDVLHRSRAAAELLVRDELVAAPPSSLNQPIGTSRRLAVMGASLEELKDVRAALGGTVNDVVLAIAAGGLRELLLDRGERPPSQGLRAMVPMNIRAAGEHLKLGNKITSLFVHLPVAEANPLTRYRRQVEHAEALKAGRQAIGSKTLVDVTALAPPALHSFLARSLFASRLFNVTITNVPGAPVPLYALGSRMREVWPIVPLAASHAVGIAVVSYDGELFFCVNADRDSVPDINVLLAGMRNSLRELNEHADNVTAAAH